MLAGITIIANGTILQYPFEICISNLAKCCDIIFINTDKNNKDDTLKRLFILQKKYPNIEILQTIWNWEITNGRDLAYRANECIKLAIDYKIVKSVLYLQADEVIDYNAINKLKNGPIHKYNIALERTYFWKDLYHINQSWTLHIPRLCLISPQLKVVGDGMSMHVDHDLAPYIHLDNRLARIFHYSRVGNTKYIAKRLNNLDSLFHKSQEYIALKDYKFGVNNNFEKNADTSEIEEVNIKHPEGVVEFYG
jgi:hypothetical protein